MDDYGNSHTTAHAITADGTEVFGTLATTGDQDWFRLTNVSRFEHYAISFRSEDEPIVRLYHGVPRNSHLAFIAGVNFHGFEARGSDDWLIQVERYRRNGDYQFSVITVDEEDPRLVGRFDRQYGPGGNSIMTSGKAYGRIHFDRDRDYTFETLLAGVTYQVELQGVATGDGNTLADPYLQVFTGLGSERRRVAFDDNSGDGKNALVEFTPDSTSRYEFVVSGKRGLGTYTLDMSLNDDFPGSPEEVDDFLALDRGSLQVTGLAHFANDNDVIGFRVEGGSHYKIQVGNDSRAWLTTESGQLFGSAFRQDLYFQATETRNLYLRHTHYAVPSVFSSKTAPFEITISKVTAPPIATKRMIGSAGQPIEDFFRQPAFEAGPGQIFSTDFELDHFDRGIVPMGVRRNVNLNRVNLTAGPTKTGEIFIRSGHPGTERQNQSHWASIPVVRRELRDQDRVRNAAGPVEEIAYHFADELPSYFSGESRINGFTPLSPGERMVMSDAITKWGDVIRTEIRETSNLAEADVVIFKSQLGFDTLAHFPGGNKGGDIVLDTDRYLWDRAEPGSRAYYEMVRAFGTALGLPGIDDMNREQSISGRRLSSELVSNVYPSTPTPYDILRVEQTYGRAANPRLNMTYTLGGDSSFVRTISEFEGYGTIEAIGQRQAVTIDLRPNQVSFSGRNFAKEREFTYYNSLDSFLDRGIGGRGNDWISGNEINNRLAGLSGDDILMGRQGRDTMIGGPGDDSYVVRFGDGLDTIRDQGRVSDVDLLRIQGVDDFRNLQDDLSFSRDGTDLLIELEPGTIAGAPVNQIRIDMNSPSSGVESLVLTNLNGSFIGRFDLPHIYQQATAEAQRFVRTTRQSDYGSLAVPFV